jgi:hypothetical protein
MRYGYIRTSVLRARGERPAAILAVRARTRNLLRDIADTTGPVIERARERGTDASGTIRRIDRLARISI